MKNFLLVLLAACLLWGCNKKESKPDLNGTWQQKSLGTKFAGINYWIHFNPDHTFQMKLMRFTDAIDPNPGSCPANRTDYVMGNYTITAGRSIQFEGKYCNADFSQEQSACDGNTDYHSGYLFSFVDNDLVLNINLDDNAKVWLVRQ